MSNIKDVAKKANVSVTTVSRVLNNRGYISQKTKDAVHNAITELNYVPNELARSLYKKKTNMIGLIIPDVSHPFFSKFAYHIENNLSKQDYKLLLCNSMFDTERVQDYMKMLLQHKVDGIIVGNHNLNTNVFDNVMLPIVGLDQYLGEQIPVVCSDHKNIGFLASKSLLDAGCKNIVNLKGYAKIKTLANLRHEIFEKEILNHGAKCTNIEMGWNVFSDFEQIIEKIFETVPNVDGIFAVDNLIAKILSSARARKINVPGELKLIGCDGIDYASLTNPTITTIQQPIKEMSENIVKIILQLIEGNEKLDKNVFIHDVKFISGETC